METGLFIVLGLISRRREEAPLALDALEAAVVTSVCLGSRARRRDLWGGGATRGLPLRETNFGDHPANYAERGVDDHTDRAPDDERHDGNERQQQSPGMGVGAPVVRV